MPYKNERNDGLENSKGHPRDCIFSHFFNFYFFFTFFFFSWPGVKPMGRSSESAGS